MNFHVGMKTLALTWSAQALVLVLAMTSVTVFANRWKNAGLVDVVWAGGFGVLALMAAWMNPGDPLRRMLLASMVTLASLRLALHLGARFRREFPKEDGRYKALRQDWEYRWRPWQVDLGFAGIYYFQGLLMWVLCLSFAWVCRNPNPEISALEWFSVALWFIGFWSEAIADAQLKRFLAKPENKGLPCQSGLWRYSRHPNYFGEWLMWLAYGLFALATPKGWLFLYAPLCMLYLLTRVSGMAATERQSLKTRGEAYRRYQQMTPAFFPGFPKQAVEKSSSCDHHERTIP